MLRVKDLTIRFESLVAVNELNFEINEGEIFCLIGPNGAGKTTCFNMISGLLKPTSGEVYLEDQRIDGKSVYEVNRLGIARTYQNLNLFRKMTVEENIMVGQYSVTGCGLGHAVLRTKKHKQEEKLIHDNAMQLLEEFNLADKHDWKADSLSYGDQRRLEMARALASKPKLLLLDEPAAGMNPSEKDTLRESIKSIRDSGVTVLLVEHDMRFVMHIADRICVLNYGKRIALGLPGEVQQNPEVIEAYLGREG